MSIGVNLGIDHLHNLTIQFITHERYQHRGIKDTKLGSIPRQISRQVECDFYSIHSWSTFHLTPIVHQVPNHIISLVDVQRSRSI